MTKIIKFHGIDPGQFPKLLDYQRTGFLRYFTKEFPYEKAEEICKKDPRAMEILIDTLFKKKKRNEAYSVFVRNRNMVKNSQILYKFDSKNLNYKEYQYMENKLITNDAFLPQAIIKNPANISKFLKMSDFNIEEKDVLFIDDSNFSCHENIFLKEKALGLDCEFRSNNCTNFADTKIAILQVASESQCAIFDVTALEKNASFVAWLTKMIESPGILKIGHSFDGDIRLLNQTFQIEMHAQNLVGVERIEEVKRIKGLKTLVKEYLGLEFCKFNQMSAWFQRPLRKSQVHYAALDAVVLIPLRKKMLETLKDKVDSQKDTRPKKRRKKKYKMVEDPKPEPEKKKESKIAEGVILFNESYSREEYHQESPKFIVENFENLSRMLRKLSLDTVYKEKYGKGELTELSRNEGRIIISGKKEIQNNCKDKWVFLKQGSEDAQIRQILGFHGISIDKSELMTRCVKCNHHELTEVGYEDVKELLASEKYRNKSISKKYQEEKAEDLERQYWLCGACKQVYWEGLQYLKDKKQLEQYVSKD